ncbi:multiple sugar transport system permease protein [Cryobacterium sp. CAN_C3]|uniref:carbohydrate ABC transporter permease n=1 Tax=unclassified Cryobacterium TaxID=2649013 RepID=UPI0018CBC384|nr:sugar ABC transporter permease [Cryobacterium sp. CAN_C3]MEC5155726.1 multiple sugar transport system permease protein [Cryobacterium sp. CAN_C3]
MANTPTALSRGGFGPRGSGGGPSRTGRRRNLTAYLFLAPFLIIFGVFVLFPAVYGLWISLHVWNPLLDSHPFVGLQNFVDLVTPGSLTFNDFWESMGATGIFVLASVPLLLAVPLAIALLLNRRIRGSAVFRGIFFAPYVLGVAVVSVLWRYLLDPQLGVVNAVLGILGLPADIPWTVDVPWAWVSLVGITVWWTLGLNTVILLAGLKGINPDLYEAAALDGAGAWGKFVNVTMPGLRPVMTFVVTVTLLASANMFGQSYLITQGGPGTETRTAIMYIANQGLTQNQMGAATAMSYVLFAMLAVVSVINFRLQRDNTK